MSNGVKKTLVTILQLLLVDDDPFVVFILVKQHSYLWFTTKMEKKSIGRISFSPVTFYQRIKFIFHK